MLKLPKGNKFRRRSVTNASPLTAAGNISPRGGGFDTPSHGSSRNPKFELSPQPTTTSLSATKLSTSGTRRRSITIGLENLGFTSASASKASPKRTSSVMQQSLITAELLYASETSLPGPAALHADNVAIFCGVRNRYVIWMSILHLCLYTN